MPLSRHLHLLLRVSGAGDLVTCDRWPLMKGFAATEGAVSLKLCFVAEP